MRKIREILKRRDDSLAGVVTRAEAREMRELAKRVVIEEEAARAAREVEALRDLARSFPRVVRFRVERAGDEHFGELHFDDGRVLSLELSNTRLLGRVVSVLEKGQVRLCGVNDLGLGATLVLVGNGGRTEVSGSRFELV
jgi:hypothetical protein